MAKNTFLVEVTFKDATRTVIPEYFFLNKFHSWGWEYSCHVQSEVGHKRFALNKDMEREIKFEMNLKDIPMGLGVQSEFTELFGRIYLNQNLVLGYLIDLSPNGTQHQVVILTFFLV